MSKMNIILSVVTGILGIALTVIGVLYFTSKPGLQDVGVSASANKAFEERLDDIQKRLDDAEVAKLEAENAKANAEAETKRVKDEVAAAEAKRISDQKIADDAEKLAEIERKAEERDKALRKEMLDAIASLAKVEAPAPTASAPESAANPASANSDNRLDSFALQYGTAMLHKEEVPPGLTWLPIGDGTVHIPIFQNPRKNNDWGFVTGEVNGGQKSPPKEFQPSAGRVWIQLDASSVPPTGVINPAGQDMKIDKAIADGALIYGTVPASGQ